MKYTATQPNRRWLLFFLILILTTTLIYVFYNDILMTKSQEIITETQEQNMNNQNVQAGQSSERSDRDLSRVFVKFGGCGSAFLYALNADDKIGLSISISDKLLISGNQSQTFDFAQLNSLVTARLDYGEQLNEEYCNDVLSNGNVVERSLIASRGTITFSTTGFDSSKPNWDRNFTITATIRGLYFVDEKGVESNEYIDEMVFEGIQVGWLPG